MRFVRRHGAIVVGYLVLALAMTWPLAGQLDTRVPSDNGDPLLSVWTMWWNARQVPFTERWWHGDIFAPATDALAFSDHRVGLGLIASPLMWAGVSPLPAYNVAFLSSYVLSGWSMYALALVVTRRRDAAFLAGLAFAFHPFRADHLPHLEVLSSYWLPLAMLALHRWVQAPESRSPWLLAAAGALTMQALSCGYYFVFGGVLVGTWLAWFVPRGLPLWSYVQLASAVMAPAAIMAPVLWHYRAAHLALGLTRSITEIEQLSADIAAFATAPAGLWAWRWLHAWPALEGALFPGLTTVLLIAAAVATRSRQACGDAADERSWPGWRRVSVALAAASAAIAALPAVGLPVSLTTGLVRVSVQTAYKPLSLAVLLAVIALAGSPALRRAWRRRSAGVYYAGATVLLWVFALGPTARLFGARVLYKAPYAWLMTLPGFADEFRAPARFAMLAALTLSVAAALAFVQLTAGWSRRRRLVGLVAALVGVVADGWVRPFPLVSPPTLLAMPAGLPREAIVLELPLGAWENAAAMYRATVHGHPVANGMSGYDPPHMTVLRAALEDGQLEVLDVLAPNTPVAMFLDPTVAPPGWVDTLPMRTMARPFAHTATHTVFMRPQADAAPWTSPEGDTPGRVAAVSASDSASEIASVVDGRPDTVWSTPGSQRGGESVTVTLAEEMDVAGIRLTLGRYPGAFPRALTISLSLDGANWQIAYQGPTATHTMRTVQADPRLVRVPVSFQAGRARFVRLEQTGASRASPWVIGELAVLKPSGER